MRRKAKARIFWVPETKGGRKSPPPGPRYVTVSRFEEHKDRYPKEAWSLVVEFSKPPDYQREIISEVSFLMDAAPHHLLHPGSRFELFEGYKLVAEGEVL